jgi:hypothetical protein
MPKFLVSHRVVALVALCLAASFAAVQQSPAQQAVPGQQPSSPGQKPADQKPDDSQQPTETLKVNVNVVQLFFNVKDKHGALIPNLTKDDFEIYEDGKQQILKYFTPETNLPLTLGMMIDSTVSQLRVLEMEKQVVGAFLSKSDRQDEAFVIDFNVDSIWCRISRAMRSLRRL